MTQSEPPLSKVGQPDTEGAAPPQWPVVVMMVIGGGVGIVALLLLFLAMGGLHRLAPQQVGDTPQLEQRIVGSFLGCRDRAVFERLTAHAPSTSLERQIRAALDTQACTRFLKGDPVYLDSVPLLRGLIQLHRRNSATKWWIDTEAVRP